MTCLCSARCATAVTPQEPGEEEEERRRGGGGEEEEEEEEEESQVSVLP